MKKTTRYVLIAFSVLMAILILYGFVSPVIYHYDCYNGGGRWTTCSNGCRDLCGAGPVCTMAITECCDCGPDKCWDGQNCIQNPSKRDLSIYDAGGYEIFLIDLGIILNGIEKEGFTASFHNEKFKKHFGNELNKIIKDIDGINDINIEGLATLDKVANIKISYNPNLTNEEKKVYLDELKEGLESEWFTENVEYNRVVYLT